MGNTVSKTTSMSYESAIKLLTAEELKRLQANFARVSNRTTDMMSYASFVQEILSEAVPRNVADQLYTAFGGTSRGLSFRSMVISLVVITKGSVNDRIRFLFQLFSDDGQWVDCRHAIDTLKILEGHDICAESLIELHSKETLSYEEFERWTMINKSRLHLLQWLLENPPVLTNVLTMPTFYQTLAGITHLDEKEIIELEKQYWSLANVDLGKLDLRCFKAHIDPLLPSNITEGLFRSFDDNYDEMIDFKELACGVSACCRGPRTERQKFCFKVFSQLRGYSADCSKSKISKDDLIAMVSLCRGLRSSNVQESANAQCLTKSKASPNTAAAFDNTDAADDVLRYHFGNKISEMSMNEFLIWAVRDNLLDDFLLILSQICHVIFGLRPNEKHEERQIIINWINRDIQHGLSAGQTWYLIAMTWWAQWEAYVGCNNGLTSGPMLVKQLPNSPRWVKQHRRGNSYSLVPLQPHEVPSHPDATQHGPTVHTNLQPISVTVPPLGMPLTEPSPISSASDSGGDKRKSQGNVTSRTASTSNASADSVNKSSSSESVGTDRSSTGSTLSRNLRSWSPCPPKSLANASSTETSVHAITTSAPPSQPGPIDNSSLIASSNGKADKSLSSRLPSLTSEGGLLKHSDVIEPSKDYQLVPAKVWHTLIRCYGLASTALPRKVILSPSTNQPEIELYPIQVIFLRNQQPQSQSTSSVAGPKPVNTQSSGAVGISGSFLTNPLQYTSGSPGTGVVNGLSNAAMSALKYVTSSTNSAASSRCVPVYTACFSKSDTIREMTSFICSQLKFAPDSIRLWLLLQSGVLSTAGASPAPPASNPASSTKPDAFPNEFSANILLDDENWILATDLKVECGAQILIEERNKDLTWPEEMSSLARTSRTMNNKASAITSKLSTASLHAPGRTGLNNLGNTCFMNSALQCISSTQPLTRYFQSGYYQYELNLQNVLGMKGQMASEYAKLLHTLWLGNTKAVAPLKLKWLIGKYSSAFADFQQHDAQELLAFVLDGLHEDLNRVVQKPYEELKDSDGRPDEEVAAEAWDNHLRRNRSVIVDLFHGLLRSRVRCSACHKESVRFDPFTFLSLPIPLEAYVYLHVVVIKLDGTVPAKYGLRLGQEDRFSIVKSELASLTGIPANGFLIADVLANSLIRSFLTDDKKARIYSGCLLYAYEIPHSATVTDNPVDHNSIHLNQTESFSCDSILNHGSVTSDPSFSGDLLDVTNSKTILSATDDHAHCNNQNSNDLYHSTARHHRSASNTSSIASSSSGYYESSTSTSTNLSNVAAAGQQGTPPAWPNGPSIRPFRETQDDKISFNGFTIGINRKTDYQEFYFMSHHQPRPVIFGLPIIIPSDQQDFSMNDDSRPEYLWTGIRVYASVWRQVSRLVSPLPKSTNNHAMDCDETLYGEYPFVLRTVNKSGRYCSTCPWHAFCTGCPIQLSTDSVYRLSACFVAIDWDSTTLHLRYQHSQEKRFTDHESVARIAHLRSQPISLDSCLKAFTAEETIDGYHCSSKACPGGTRKAIKHMDIWHLPPILIFHIKRFQCVNERWMKSSKEVKFPFSTFDPTPYVAPPQQQIQSPPPDPFDITPMTTHPDKDIASRAPEFELCSSIRSQEPTDQGEPGESLAGTSHARETENTKETRVETLDPSKLPHLPIDSTNNNIGNYVPTNHKSDPGMDNDATGASSVTCDNFTNGSSSDSNNSVSREGNTSSSERTRIRFSSTANILQLPGHGHHLATETDVYSLKYDLYAITCHSGMLGAGHYVTYAKHDTNNTTKWVLYNDSSCKDVQPDDIETSLAYILFYQRSGLDVDKYMPSVSGRNIVDISTSTDSDFEEFSKKYCVIQ